MNSESMKLHQSDTSCCSARRKKLNLFDPLGLLRPVVGIEK